MPVSRPTPPYLQSPWHSPTTTKTAFSEATARTSVSTQPGAVTEYYTEQQVVLVPASRTRKARRPVTLWREEELVEDDDVDENDAKSSGTEQKAVERSQQYAQQRPVASGAVDGYGSGGGITYSRGENAEEKQSDDVVLDIDDSPLPSAAPSLSSSLYSLIQPLTAFSAAPSAASSASPSAAALLARYNPRIINGYLDRRRPHSRKLLAVPNELLPPPPFAPPSYPLSTRSGPTRGHFDEKETDSAEMEPTKRELTIDLSGLTASTSTSSFLAQLPSHLSSSSAAAQWSDPASLASSGLQLRDNVLLPRGSPRTLHQGCVVYDVSEGSRAWQAGVRSGDAVVGVEGREVRSEDECVRCVNRVCGRVSLTVRRDGELVELTM